MSKEWQDTRRLRLRLYLRASNMIREKSGKSTRSMVKILDNKTDKDFKEKYDVAVKEEESTFHVMDAGRDILSYNFIHDIVERPFRWSSLPRDDWGLAISKFTDEQWRKWRKKSKEVTAFLMKHVVNHENPVARWALLKTLESCDLTVEDECNLLGKMDWKKEYGENARELYERKDCNVK